MNDGESGDGVQAETAEPIPNVSEMRVGRFQLVRTPDVPERLTIHIDTKDVKVERRDLRSRARQQPEIVEFTYSGDPVKIHNLLVSAISAFENAKRTQIRERMKKNG